MVVAADLSPYVQAVKGRDDATSPGRERYILAGKVDLLLGGAGKLELLDFKISPRPKDSRELIAAYERQLCTYAHILKRRPGRHVDRLLLYWTSEPRKEDALMALPYDPRGSQRPVDTSTRRCGASRRAPSR